jgi:hypothetical protein
MVKIESVYNTDPTPVAGTDDVLVEEPNSANEGLRMTERPAVRPSLAALQSIYGGRLKTITFAVELKGSGTAGTPPEIDPLLRACGYAVTNVPVTSDTYKPASSSLESCTIYDHKDGKREILTGCVGTFTAVCEAGMPVKLNFTMTGHVVVPTDVSLPTPTYDSTLPVPFKSATLTIGGYSAVINALNIDAGNEVAMPPSVNASDGYGTIQIVSRNISGSFDPEDTLVATKDWWGEFVAGTNVAINTGVIGSTAGNKFQITQPACYYNDMSEGDREGIASLEVPYNAIESSGDDELTLAFT